MGKYTEKKCNCTQETKMILKEKMIKWKSIKQKCCEGKYLLQKKQD